MVQSPVKWVMYSIGLAVSLPEYTAQRRRRSGIQARMKSATLVQRDFIGGCSAAQPAIHVK